MYFYGYKISYEAIILFFFFIFIMIKYELFKKIKIFTSTILLYNKIKKYECKENLIIIVDNFWDENNNEYIDYLIGSGPMLLGHGHPEVMEAIFEQLPNGLTFFANNSKGIELAEEICKAVKSSEQVRFVSSGGEADMYAMRLARAFTGKDKIIKFEGGYH